MIGTAKLTRTDVNFLTNKRAEAKIRPKKPLLKRKIPKEGEHHMPQSRRGRMRSRRDKENRGAISERAKRTNNSGAGVPTSAQERRAGGGGGFFGWAANRLPGGSSQPVIQEEDGELAELRRELTEVEAELDKFDVSSGDPEEFTRLMTRRAKIRDEITGARAQP